MSDDRYRLIDFGDGRKLESLAGRLIDRPSPAAESVRPRSPQLWQQAESHFCVETKKWTHRSAWPESISLDCGGFVMPVHPTPFGHIGLFPEQQDNWAWLKSRPADVDPNVDASVDAKLALNLFAYTGASTMALAMAGYQVAHVDAAKPNVAAARQAALLNGRSDLPIRYLVDDAAKFVAREVRRKRCYDTIVLDPPAYGHSPQGKAWRLQRDLWPMLDDCLSLVDPTGFRLLVTGHSWEVTPSDVVRFLRDHIGKRQIVESKHCRFDTGRSFLKDQSGRKLDTGFFVRLECRLES